MNAKSDPKPAHKGFSSKAGLIAATIGSAVGLGNIWRFPNEVHANGGAAFLIVYIGCVFLLGIPVMLAEFSLGRDTDTDTVGAYRKYTPNSYWWIAGAIALAAAYLINAFYMVVAGWTVEYLWTSMTGSLYEGINAADVDSMNGVFQSRMQESIQGTWTPLIFLGVVLFINIFVLLRGVQKGIEKMSNLLMPVLILIMMVLCTVSVSLPNAFEGVVYFLKPDFSRFTPQVFMNALGQAFFSLSLGMGILVTYASYFPKKIDLVSTAGSVAIGDFLVALMMGFMVFPAVMSFGLGQGGAGLESTALVFITLPEVFVRMGGTQFWSIIFFLLLFIAALTSTISISEVAVKFCQDRFKLSRVKAVLTVMLPLFILSPLCSLSLGGGASWLQIGGQPLFDFLDTTTTNYFLPAAAFLTCLYIGWRLPSRVLMNQLTNHGKINAVIAPAIAFIIRWLAPLAIAAIFFYGLL